MWLRKSIVIIDCVSVTACLLFVIGLWTSSELASIMKPIPVFLSGACVCLLIGIDTYGHQTSNKFFKVVSHCIASIAFLCYSLGDLFLEVGDESTAATWLTVGGVLFGLGQTVFIVYAIVITTTTTTSAQKDTNCAIELSLVVVLDVAMLVLACWWMPRLSASIAGYLSIQLIQCIVVGMCLCDTLSNRCAALFVCGVTLFSISDIVMFAIDYEYISIIDPCNHLVVMVLYWAACLMLTLGCRFAANSMNTVTTPLP